MQNWYLHIYDENKGNVNKTNETILQEDASRFKSVELYTKCDSPFTFP